LSSLPGDTPTITRCAFDEKDQFVRDETVGGAGLGVTSALVCARRRDQAHCSISPLTRRTSGKLLDVDVELAS